jgi:ArsR family transcriptional regulator, arsenate/arsenite/antimonite-responsive transcriptional repressor
MKLLEIYRCLCDETRLRILNLLTKGPLCVCHFQSILDLPQVAVSKHLAYLRKHALATATRQGQWMVYQLPEKRSKELHLQLQCLQDCVRSIPVFQQDLKRLKKLQCGCDRLRSPASAQRNRNILNPHETIRIKKSPG